MFIPGILLALIYFIWHNDKLYRRSSRLYSSTLRWSPAQVKQAAEKASGTNAPLLKAQDLPPKTGRRYIIVGGSGFVGGWVVAMLLRRGEDPRNVRIVDLRAPFLPEQLEQLAAGVEFIQTDITDRDVTIYSFTKSWASPNPSGGLTVFHCAAAIRYFERSKLFLPRCARINVEGTRNVIEAAVIANADILLYTSSALVVARPARLLSFPWESERSVACTQALDEDDREGEGTTRLHNDFVSNYAETKFQGELLVRKANQTNGGNLRTGIIRPGAILFGPSRQDPVILGLLRRQWNPLWGRETIQHLLYIENCVLAHLLYEQRLLETQSCGKDVGGRTYLVVDTPCRSSDLTMALNVLTSGRITFFNISPTLMYLFSHLVEAYELLHHYYPILQKILPRAGGDLIKLQPASHQAILANHFYDDSLIRSPVEKEGLGYQAKISSLDAVCHTVKWLEEHVIDT